MSSVKNKRTASRRKKDRRKNDRRNDSNITTGKKGNDNKIDWMSKSSFFNNFSEEDKIDFLNTSPKFLKFNKNNLIIRKGDPDQSVFIILIGSANVMKNTNKQELIIASLKAGDTFGEISFLRKGPRAFDVKAKEPTVVISITAEHIESLPLDLQRIMKNQFLQIMLRRFEDINKKYTELLAQSLLN